MKIPVALALRLALAIALDTAVQLLWKVASMRLPGSTSVATTLEAMLREPLFLLVAALFAWQLVNWLRVLERSDLSYSQPITSLALVSVFALSVLLLGERIEAMKLAGTALVFGGVWFISRTPHDTRPAGGSAP